MLQLWAIKKLFEESCMNTTNFHHMLLQSTFSDSGNKCGTSSEGWVKGGANWES